MMTAIKKYFFLFFLISINAYGGATIAPQCKYNDRIIIQFGKSKPSWDASDKSNYSISGNTIRYAAYDKKRNVSALILNNALMYGQEYTVAANNDSTTFTFYGDSDQAEISFDDNKFLTDKDINYSWYSSFFLWDSPFGIYGKTNFIGEYTGYVNLAKKYEVNVESIDGFRIFLNNDKVLDRWSNGYQIAKFTKKEERWAQIKIQMYNDGSRPTPWFWFEEYARFKVSSKNMSQCVPSKYKPKPPVVDVNAPDTGSLCGDTIIDVYSKEKSINISAKHGTFSIFSGKGKIKNGKYYFDKKDKNKVRLKLTNKRQLTDTWYIGDKTGEIKFLSTQINLSTFSDIAHTSSAVTGQYINYNNGICGVADINEVRDVSISVKNEKNNGTLYYINSLKKSYNKSFLSKINVVNGTFFIDVNFPLAGMTTLNIIDEEMSGNSSVYVKPDDIIVSINNLNTSGKNEKITLTVTGNGKPVTNYNLLDDSISIKHEKDHPDMAHDGTLVFPVENNKFVNGVYDGSIKYSEVGFLKIFFASKFFEKNTTTRFIPYDFVAEKTDLRIKFGEDNDWMCNFNIFGQGFRNESVYIELIAKNFEGNIVKNYQGGLYSFNKKVEVSNSINSKKYVFDAFSGGAGSIVISIPELYFETEGATEPKNQENILLNLFLFKETLFDDFVTAKNGVTLTSENIPLKFGKVELEDVTSGYNVAQMPVKFYIYEDFFKESDMCFDLNNIETSHTVEYEISGNVITVKSNGIKRIMITGDIPEYLIYKESNKGFVTFEQSSRGYFHLKEVYR